MINERFKNIQDVLKTFTGKDGEPKDSVEFYILKSLWVMLCAEFESCLKESVERHIDCIKKTKKIDEINICLLIQNKYGKGDQSNKLSPRMIMELFKGSVKDIKYDLFTRNKITRYKAEPVAELLNYLGIFISEEEMMKLKMLDGIASTRDAIAHGDSGITITRKELEDNVILVLEIYQLLRAKLLP